MIPLVGLRCSTPPYSTGRPDLFQKSRKTLAELQRRHASLQIEEQDRLQTYPTGWPAMDHVERTVFSNPRTITPSADATGLEILAGGRQIGEIEMIGRRIKRLLLEGVRPSPPAGGGSFPGQIAVVFRRPQPVAELVSEVFERLEIPFFLENGRSLGRVPAIVMLLPAGIGCRRLADAQAAGRAGKQLLRPGLDRLERSRRRPGRAARSANCKSRVDASACWKQQAGSP